MSNWRVARSLLQLRDQVNKEWPGRSKVADGTIGDAAHSARSSDHNPNSAGVVCAMDITHDPKNGVDIGRLSDALVESNDDRISYLIANALIWSADDKRWVPYHGPNPHRHHIHVSVRASKCDVLRPWAIGKPEDRMDQETSITQATDVSIGAAKGGSITRPFRWWLSAAYAHIIGLEAPVKKIGDAVAAQGLQLSTLTTSQAALTTAQVLQATAQTALLTQIRELVVALNPHPPAGSQAGIDVNLLAEAIATRLSDSNASDIARRIDNG